MNNITDKIRRKFFARLYQCISVASVKRFFCKGYWHGLLCDNMNRKCEEQYLVPQINYGAGIAHQLSCWTIGYYIAQEYGLHFATTSFFINGQHAEETDKIVIFKLGRFEIYKPSDTWDRLLGVSEGEISVSELKRRHYKRVNLPRFEENDILEKDIIWKIIKSYTGKKVYFVVALDQEYNYTNKKFALLYQNKFWNAKERADDIISFDRNEINIVMHIRRGDVNEETHPNRFLHNKFYEGALEEVMNDLNKEERKVAKVYILSEGEEKDFSEFTQRGNVQLCLDWDAKKSFLHMVYADYIVAGLSGFSVDAATMAKGKRYAPQKSFRYYPRELEWNLLDNNSGRLIEVLGKRDI